MIPIFQPNCRMWEFTDFKRIIYIYSPFLTSQPVTRVPVGVYGKRQAMKPGVSNTGIILFKLGDRIHIHKFHLNVSE